MWFEKLDNYLGSRFGITPSKNFITKLEARKSEFLGKTTIAFVRDGVGEKLMGWAWLYARGFKPMYKAFVMSHFLDAVLSKTEAKEGFLEDAESEHLIVLLPEMPLNDFSKQYIPTFIKQRDFSEDGQTLIIAYPSMRGILPVKEYTVIDTTVSPFGYKDYEPAPVQVSLSQTQKPINGTGGVEF